MEKKPILTLFTKNGLWSDYQSGIETLDSSYTVPWKYQLSSFKKEPQMNSLTKSAWCWTSWFEKKKKKMQPLWSQKSFQKHAWKNLKNLLDWLVRTELLPLFSLHGSLTLTHRWISVSLYIIITVQALLLHFSINTYFWPQRQDTG